MSQYPKHLCIFIYLHLPYISPSKKTHVGKYTLRYGVRIKTKCSKLSFHPRHTLLSRWLRINSTVLLGSFAWNLVVSSGDGYLWRGPRCFFQVAFYWIKSLHPTRCFIWWPWISFFLKRSTTKSMQSAGRFRKTKNLHNSSNITSCSRFFLEVHGGSKLGTGARMMNQYISIRYIQIHN